MAVLEQVARAYAPRFVDRLTFGNMIQTGTHSVRLAHTNNQRGGNRGTPKRCKRMPSQPTRTYRRLPFQH